MLRNVLSNWLGLVIRGLISFALTPLLVHYLGDFNFGLWVLVMSVAGYCGILDLGIRPTMHRYVATLKATNDEQGLDETLASALAVACGIGLLVILLTLASLPIIPTFFRLHGASLREFHWLLALLGLDIAILFPARILGSYLCGSQRFDLYNIGEIVSSIVRAILTIIVLLEGLGVTGVAAVTLGGTVLLLFLNLAMVRRIDPRRTFDLRRAPWSRIRELGAYSFYLLLMTAGDYLRFYTDSIVIARVLTIALVTPFSVASRLLEYFKAVLFGLAGPMVPRMSELNGQSKSAEVREVFVRGTRVTALVSFFIGAALIMDGRTLLTLWVGQRFASSDVILVILTVGYVVILAQQPSIVYICAINRHQFLGWWTLVEGGLNLLLSVHWAKKYGLVGVALGTLIPMLVTGLIVQPLYAVKLLRLPITTYISESLARPFAVLAVFTPLAAAAIRPYEGASVLALAIIVVGQASLFSLLAFAFGLEPRERTFVSTRVQTLARTGLRWARTLEVGS